MLSSLPKLADKAFVVGFLLPTTLFVIAFLATISRGHLGAGVLAALADGSITKLVYFVLTVWVLSVALMLLNTTLYKILEGYTWPFAYCSKLWARRAREFDTLKTRVTTLRERRRSDKNSLSPEEAEELQDKWVELTMRFPPDSSILLPTRLGNAILSFEQYPKDVYDADGVTLWYHLVAVMPKEFQAAIGDARAQVDALVNLVFLALAISAMALALAGWHLRDSLQSVVALWSAMTTSRNSELLLVGIGGLLVAYLSYTLAIQRAYSWGNWVRAAYDCYLPEVAKTLGLMLPADGEEQRRFWRSVTFRASLNYRFNPAPWARVETTTARTVTKEKTEMG